MIFRQLACRFLAGQHVEPARECPFVQPLSTAIRLARKAAALQRLDVNRSPRAPGRVLEMFRTHRRFSNAAENPKWIDNTPSNSGAGPGRLRPTNGWQEKSAASGPAQLVGRAAQFCRTRRLLAGPFIDRPILSMRAPPSRFRCTRK
jgi:hypothetical protein